ncbi:MAG: response regulator [Aquabacterium sp.]
MSEGFPVNVDDQETQPKVLLVDDDEVNLLLTSIALRERGFAIFEEPARANRPCR